MENTTNMQQLRPFWAKDREETLQARIGKINKLNDPTTSADEILRWGKVVLFFLLGYSTLLGFFCYFKSFSKSFPIEVAFIFSCILPVAIEFGKNYCATWAIRQPFFHGFASIFASKAKTFIFAGLALIAIVTYGMSVRNSTVGAEQLSLMFSHERNAATFTPDTRVIDDQIAATQQSINENRGIKWKGTVTYQAQKSIQSQTKALTTLQAQRQESIQQQRADWEQDQTYKSDQGNNIAGLVLASGGFVELLQILFQFLRVACEKLLDNRISSSSATFQFSPNQNGQARQPNAYPTIENLVYFNRSSPSGNVQPAPPPPDNTVSQCVATVTQQNTEVAAHSLDDVLKLSEKRLRGFACNFDEKHRRNDTVHANICTILDETFEKLKLYKHLGYYPTRAQAIKFYTYITGELFKSLNERGWPYNNDVEFAQVMFDLIPKKEPAT